MPNKEEVKEIVNRLLSCELLEECLTSEERLRLTGILHEEFSAYDGLKKKTISMSKYLFGYNSNGNFIPGIDRKLDKIVKQYNQLNKSLAALIGALIVDIVIRLFS